MKEVVSYLLHNPTLTLLVASLLFSLSEILRCRSPRSRSAIVEALFSWFVFFTIGVSYLYNALVHTVYAEQTAQFIGWANSPFQLEVGFASIGFAVIGLIAFRGSWTTRLCAVLGTACFELGAAGGHIYQMIHNHDFAPGNAGVVFYTDIFLPLIGFILLYLSRPSAMVAQR